MFEMRCINFDDKSCAYYDTIRKSLTWKAKGIKRCDSQNYHDSWKAIVMEYLEQRRSYWREASLEAREAFRVTLIAEK